MDSRIDSEYHSLAAMDPPVTARASGESGHRLLFLVTVRLERSRRTSRYQTGDVPTQPGDVVVVDAERGTALGRVIGQAVNTWVKASETPPRVLRRIQESDPWSRDRHTDREDAFRRECAASAAAYGLDLKVTDAEFLHWENRVIFYFVSEGRVDFRDLVRELSRRLRCRVEMRQVGPRDETRLLGGVGTCGREFCCATHLTQFESIRIRMVKDQGLVLNPQKVSGGCGKLKCCLAYEVDVYRDLRKGMPALGRMVQTPDGPGKVREVNVLSRKVGVLLDGQGGYKTYLAALLSSPEGEAYDPEGRARLEEAEREEAADLGGHDGAPPPEAPGNDGPRDGAGEPDEASHRSRRRRGRRSRDREGGPPAEGHREGPPPGSRGHGRPAAPAGAPPSSHRGAEAPHRRPPEAPPAEGHDGEAGSEGPDAERRRRSRRRRSRRGGPREGGGETGPAPAER